MYACVLFDDNSHINIKRGEGCGGGFFGEKRLSQRPISCEKTRKKDATRSDEGVVREWRREWGGNMGGWDFLCLDATQKRVRE